MWVYSFNNLTNTCACQEVSAALDCSSISNRRLELVSFFVHSCSKNLISCKEDSPYIYIFVLPSHNYLVIFTILFFFFSFDLRGKPFQFDNS